MESQLTIVPGGRCRGSRIGRQTKRQDPIAGRWRWGVPDSEAGREPAPGYADDQVIPLLEGWIRVLERGAQGKGTRAVSSSDDRLQATRRARLPRLRRR